MTCTVSLSFDDGAVEDTRLARLLARHGLPATFYVPRYNPERPVIEIPALRELAAQFEIGAHTLNHVDLTRVKPEHGQVEVRNSKRWLEDLLGRTVSSFCFPGGGYHAPSLAWVEQAGFTLARTADWFSDVLVPGKLTLANPTIQAYPQPFVVHLAHCLRTRNFRSLRTYLPLALGSWENLARRAFDRCLESGGVFHLWGHSWEIATMNLWEPLDRVLAHIAGRPGVRYVPNSGLATALPGDGG